MQCGERAARFFWPPRAPKLVFTFTESQVENIFYREVEVQTRKVISGRGAEERKARANGIVGEGARRPARKTKTASPT